MMLEGSRWECPGCHRYTLTKPGEQVTTCQHCGATMSVPSVIFVVAANMAAKNRQSKQASD